MVAVSRQVAFRASNLKAELFAYKAAAAIAPVLDKSVVHAFPEGVLTFWRQQGLQFKAWRNTARIVFSMPPTSVALERA